MWRDVFHPRTGRLLFRYDPERAIIQVQERREKVTVDLQQFMGMDIITDESMPPDEIRMCSGKSQVRMKLR